MTEFLVALGVFLCAHLVPSSPRIRASLIAQSGRSRYLIGYSILSVALLGWLIIAARRAETIALWGPATWQWYVPFVTMPVAAFLLMAGLLAPNPLSITFRAGSETADVIRITRHPIVWAFLIWAVAHIPPNGDLVSLILFGGMALFSILGFALLDLKARRRLGQERWQVLARSTSIVPFAALVAGHARLTNIRPLLVAGAAASLLYTWFIFHGHRLLIGPDPLDALYSFH